MRKGATRKVQKEENLGLRLFIIPPQQSLLILILFLILYFSKMNLIIFMKSRSVKKYGVLR